MSFFRMCLVVAFNTKRCQVLIVKGKVRSVFKMQYVMNHYRRFQPSVLLAVSAEVFVSAKDLFSFLSPSLIFVKHSCFFRCVKERDTAGADGVPNFYRRTNNEYLYSICRLYYLTKSK